MVPAIKRLPFIVFDYGVVSKVGMPDQASKMQGTLAFIYRSSHGNASAVFIVYGTVKMIHHTIPFYYKTFMGILFVVWF